MQLKEDGKILIAKSYLFYLNICLLRNEEVCGKNRSHSPSTYLLLQTDSTCVIDLYEKTDTEISDANE